MPYTSLLFDLSSNNGESIGCLNCYKHNYLSSPNRKAKSIAEVTYLLCCVHLCSLVVLLFQKTKYSLCSDWKSFVRKAFHLEIVPRGGRKSVHEATEQVNLGY